MIPYGCQTIEQDDIDAAVRVLQSDWLTCGPTVEKFEESICEYVGADYGVAVSSGTAALHLATRALGIGPGDEVIVPTMSFAATANCVAYCGGTPIFCDVEPDTLLIDPAKVGDLIRRRTKAIIAVDYAGQPADYDALKQFNLPVVADACHALGARYQGQRMYANMQVYSFHPVKTIAIGEGGMIVTNNAQWANSMRSLRNHAGAGRGNQTALGFNYRLSDIHCALGVSQSKKIDRFVSRRREIAGIYDKAFENTMIRPLALKEGNEHAYHLYVVRVSERDRIKDRLFQRGINAGIHYRPTHLHDFYKKHYYTFNGLCPVAEDAWQEILSLPIYPTLTDRQIEYIVNGMVRR